LRQLTLICFNLYRHQKNVDKLAMAAIPTKAIPTKSPKLSWTVEYSVVEIEKPVPMDDSVLFKKSVSVAVEYPVRLEGMSFENEEVANIHVVVGLE